jgi:hypothetical protein
VAMFCFSSSSKLFSVSFGMRTFPPVDLFFAGDSVIQERA